MYSKIAERSSVRVAQPPGGGSCRSLSMVRVAKKRLGDRVGEARADRTHRLGDAGVVAGLPERGRPMNCARRGRSDGWCPSRACEPPAPSRARRPRAPGYVRRHAPADDPGSAPARYNQPSSVQICLMSAAARGWAPRAGSSGRRDRRTAQRPGRGSCSPSAGAYERPEGPPGASAAPRASRRPGSPRGTASRARTVDHTDPFG